MSATPAQLRLGILGLHNHYHANPMAAMCRDGLVDARIVAVYDPRRDLAAGFADEYLIPTIHDSRESLLASDEVDAVLVMSDTASHVEDVIAAAAHGKHVLIDKPLALTTDECDRMIAATTRAATQVSVAFHIRFAPPYLRARQLIADGVIGTPLSMRIAIRVPLEYVKNSPTDSEPGWYADPARSGGGGFLDHGVHYVDAMRFLLGSEASSVTAVVGNLASPDLPVDDYGVCIITTDRGQVVTVESTWHAPGWYAPESSPEECHIVGTLGEIVLRYHGEPQLEYSAAGIDGRQTETWQGDDRGAIAYRRIVEEFVEIVRSGVSPHASAADGREATRVIEAAYAAARTGTSIVLEPEGNPKWKK